MKFQHAETIAGLLAKDGHMLWSRLHEEGERRHGDAWTTDFSDADALAKAVLDTESGVAALISPTARIDGEGSSASVVAMTPVEQRESLAALQKSDVSQFEKILAEQVVGMGGGGTGRASRVKEAVGRSPNRGTLHIAPGEPQPAAKVGRFRVSTLKGKARVRKNKTLVAAYIGDGYLYGASDDDNAAGSGYWINLSLDEDTRRDGWELVELNNVPDDIAQKLIDQGTSDQWYDDGYDAAQAAAPYVGETVYTAEPEGGESDDESIEMSKGRARKDDASQPGDENIWIRVVPMKWDEENGYVEDVEAVGEEWEGPLSDHLEANADWELFLDDNDLDYIRNSEPGGDIVLAGGGASPVWSVQRIEPPAGAVKATARKEDAERWSLASDHPAVDICDENAEADNYDLGAGVYPAGRAPEFPAHPGCKCSLDEITVGEKAASRAGALELAMRKALTAHVKRDKVGLEKAAAEVASVGGAAAAVALRKRLVQKADPTEDTKPDAEGKSPKDGPPKPDGDEPPKPDKPDAAPKIPSPKPGDMLILRRPVEGTVDGADDAEPGTVMVAYAGERNGQTYGYVQNSPGELFDPGEEITFEGEDVVAWIDQALDAEDVVERNADSWSEADYQQHQEAIGKDCYPFAVGGCVPLHDDVKALLLDALAGAGGMPAMPTAGGSSAPERQAQHGQGATAQPAPAAPVGAPAPALAQ